MVKIALDLLGFAGVKNCVEFLFWGGFFCWLGSVKFSWSIFLFGTPRWLVFFRTSLLRCDYCIFGKSISPKFIEWIPRMMSLGK